jgi:hypothetical protein
MRMAWAAVVVVLAGVGCDRAPLVSPDPRFPGRCGPYFYEKP